MDAEAFIRNQMQHLIRTAPMPQLLSMPYHQSTEIKHHLEALPNELKDLFHKLFNPDKIQIKLDQILPFKAKKGSVPFCHGILTIKVQSYRCFDCQIHPSSLLCEDCFKRGNHKGHRYLRVKEQGVCDCGCKNLIKESCFCPEHSGEEEIIEIDSSEEFVFNLYIRQLFIWILKLMQIQPKDGETLLYHLLIYLTELNNLSPYYNRLTTRAIFGQTHPLADHIFSISLHAAERVKLVQAALNLFFKMLVLREFKERLLTSLIDNYNRIENFEISKYVKLFYPLLNEPQVVLSAMKRYPIALRPQRPFNVTTFYEELAMINDINPAAAQAFLAPLLTTDTIIFPFLGKVEERCEKMNHLIVTVFPEFQKEEYMYYKLIACIIKVIQDKNLLASMIRNYCKLILQYSFKKNKIILVPQRVLVLLIYKYFDYDLQKINAEEIRNIVGLQMNEFQEQIQKNWVKFAECIFQFCMNLNRTNYFDNYLSIYVKEKGQVICIDYLGFKIMAALCNYQTQTFQLVLAHVYRVDNDKLNREIEQKVDYVKSINIFLKVLIEIIYSPRTETIVSAFLGRTHPRLASFLKGLLKSTGEITQQQLEDIGKLFAYGELDRNIIDASLTFDSQKKKYIPKEGEENSNEVSLEFFVSLLQTKFSKFIQRKSESEKYLDLDPNQQRLKNVLLNRRLLYVMAIKQLMLIEGNPDDKKLIKDLIIVFKTIKFVYLKQEKEYEELIVDILNEIKARYPTTEALECPNRQFIQEIQKQLVNNTTKVHALESKEDKDTLKRRELLKLKKEKMMKTKKIKQNQEKYLQPQHNQQEQAHLHQYMCLICRENKNLENICYVGKMRLSNLLYEFMEAPGDNAIFKSCYHTVHFECFARLQKTKEAAACPLCKDAINILLPIQDTYHFGLLERISNRIEHVLNYFILTGESKDKRGFVLEVILYFAYLFAVNLDDLGKISEKQIKLCRILYTLVDHNLSFEDRQVKSEACFQLLTNKMENYQFNKKIHIYRDLVNFIQCIVFWNANNSSDLDLPLGCINVLSFGLKVHKVFKILQIINSFISPPEISALEPIIISSEQICQKLSEQSEEPKFMTFWTPPSDLKNLFELRDSHASHCGIGHQICICLICHQPSCHSCKKVSDHAAQRHPKECIFFNTYSGGLLYYFHGLEVAIKCLYINDLCKTWKPELNADGFVLDWKLYDEILLELKGGSVFKYVITTFAGLRGSNITDRI